MEFVFGYTSWYTFKPPLFPCLMNVDKAAMLAEKYPDTIYFIATIEEC